MNIKVALGCISVSAALAFWACADGEVITADASEEVALQQVLHNRVTVEEAIASCNGNEACVAEMTDAPAADAPDSPKDEGSPDNAESSASADNGSSLPGTNPGAGDDPVVTPSSPSVVPDVPVTPVTPTTSSASVTPVSSASQGGGQSSASTPTTSSASTPKSSASAIPTDCEDVSLTYQGAEVEFKAGSCYSVKCSKGELVCKTKDGSSGQFELNGISVAANPAYWGSSGKCGVVSTSKDLVCKNDY